MAEIEAIADKLRDILIKSGVKFSADQVEWAMTSKDAGLTNDINTYVPPNAVLSKSHIIFLERGNSKAGLEHIVLRHAKDFQAKDGINTAKQISDYIFNVMAQSMNIVHTAAYKKGGLNLVYKIKSNNYLRVVIGSNGFIVTAYPSSSP